MAAIHTGFSYFANVFSAPTSAPATFTPNDVQPEGGGS